MSLDEKNHFSESMKTAFDTWDAGSPADLWDDLNASLSIESVFQRVDASLEKEGSSADEWLKASHENWTPSTNIDGWERIQEELSRERVWNRLDTSLSSPIETVVPWLKMAVASVVAIFVSFYFSNAVYQVEIDQMQISAGVTTASNEGSHSENIPTPTDESTHPFQHTDEIIQTAPQNRANQAVLADHSRSEVQQTIQSVPEVVEGTSDVSSTFPEAVDRIGVVSPYLMTSNNLATMRDVKLIPLKQPNWFIQLGTQIASLNERNRGSFTTAIPRPGFVADLAYSFHLGRFYISEAAGFSQFAQSNGKYINGRYFNTNQKLNTVQLSSIGGIRLRRTSFYTGVVLSRLINGFEEKQNSVANVYNASSIQMGITAGMNYKLKQFDNGNQFGLGLQYHYMPRLKSSNVEFNDLQGLRFQAKFSF